MENVGASFDYDTHGSSYARYRQADPRIASQIFASLGDAATLLNVGVGAGSYEPADRYVVAVEPSRTMRQQRLQSGRTPAVDIPFDCADGFQEALYGRPEAFLDSNVRRNQSAWGLVDAETQARLLKAFSEELATGEWDRKYGHYRRTPAFTGALRILSVELGGGAPGEHRAARA